MKIVQILPALESGGVERGTLEIARGLTNRGHTSIVISSGGRLTNTLERQGSTHITWDLGKKSIVTLLEIKKLSNWLLKERPDIVHARSRLPAWITWLALQRLPPRQRPHFITTVHGLYSVNRYSKIMCKGERVIAVSETVKNYITENYPDVPQSIVRVIPRGIDPKEFPYNFKPSQDWLNYFFNENRHLKNKTILTLPARLTRLKGHHDFITLVTRLVKEGYNVHGLIVGGEDRKRKQYANELYSRVEKENLKDYISFTGNRADIREIMSISSIVYSLSKKPESFGRTTLEALSLGRPVIGYDHGGVAEILNSLYPHGKVSADKPEELVEATTKLIQQPIAPPENNIYLLDQMIESTLACYEEVIKTKA